MVECGLNYTLIYPRKSGESSNENKGKAIHIEAWTSPEGSRRSRFSGFQKSVHEGGKLSAVHTGRLYPARNISLFISVRG
jgi:hypothetical protein